MINDDMEIFGIYNADGGIVGELKYGIGKMFKSNHCFLCDITHGVQHNWLYIRQFSYKVKRRLWKQFLNNLPVPLRLLHLNEQTNDMAKFTMGKTPCVLIEMNNEYTVLLNSEELKSCEGNVSKFIEVFQFKLNSCYGLTYEL